MIGNVSYNEIEGYVKELNASTATIRTLATNNNFSELEEFIATVENYSKFLKNTVDMYKTAEQALAYLSSKTKS